MAMPTIFGAERALLDQMEHGEIVSQRASGGDDFDEIGLKGLDAVGSVIEVFGAREVVETDEEGRAGGVKRGAEFGELRGSGFFGRFDFEVDDVAAAIGGFVEYLKLGGQGAGEVAAVLLAPAGGDGGDIATSWRGIT